MEPQDEFVFGLQAEIGRLMRELAAAKEEIERLKEKARDCERRTFRYGEEAKEAEERAEAAESSLTSERKETERLREALATVGELVRDATNHSSCEDCTVERKMESVHEYIASELAALQSRQGEE